MKLNITDVQNTEVISFICGISSNFNKIIVLNHYVNWLPQSNVKGTRSLVIQYTVPAWYRYITYFFVTCMYIHVPVYHRHTLYVYWESPIIKEDMASIQMTFQVSVKNCLMKCYLLNHLDCNFLPHYFFFTWCALHGFLSKEDQISW